MRAGEHAEEFQSAPRRCTLVTSPARRQLEFHMRQVIVDQWGVLVAHPSELLLYGFELVIGHVIELHQSGSCSFDATQQFIELQGDNSCLSVLRILDQENHQEGDNRRTGVDE
jgi:hypothetical protein